MLTKTLITVLLFAAPQIITGPYRKVFSAGGGCPGFPATNLQLKSTNVTGSGGSNVTTWPDSSGHSVAVSFSGSALLPTIDNLHNAPNGQQSIQMLGNQTGVLTPALALSQQWTVCAVYELNDVSVPHALTTDGVGGGGFNYNVVGTSDTPQYINNSFSAFIVQASETPLVNHIMTTCVAADTTSAATFYRWDGTNSGVDAITPPFTASTLTQGIGAVFSDNSASSPMQGYIWQLDIIGGTIINGTQAAAYHTCAVNTYGVP